VRVTLGRAALGADAALGSREPSRLHDLAHGPPYGVIYADPPWPFKVWGKDTGSGRSAESHYRTMELADIVNLPVRAITAKDALLFLWVPMPLLPEGISILGAWGFKYKTVAFTWAKVNDAGKPAYGMGYWTRANSELVLLGTRGKPKRQAADVLSLVLAPRRDHSAKPPEVRDRIVRLMGDVPRIELFARERAEGWHALGDALDGRDMAVSLAEMAADALWVPKEGEA
jgi:N6-adenosine-specific RNA methylase IME4